MSCITIHLKLAHYQLMKCSTVRAFVQKREYLTWPEDPQDLDWFYERLISKMNKDSKVKKFAENTPKAVQSVGQPKNEDSIELGIVRAEAT